MLTSKLSLAWLLVMTSGFGLGVLSSLPLVAWILCIGRNVRRYRTKAKTISALIALLLLLTASFGFCVSVSFQLRPLMKFTLRIADPNVFSLFLGTSTLGMAIPVFATIAITYDWSHYYDVPGLKEFVKRFGLVALANNSFKYRGILSDTFHRAGLSFSLLERRGISGAGQA